MPTRKEKVEELMRSFHALRRSTAFRPMGPKRTSSVTPSQWGVLMRIGHGKDSTVKDIAEALQVSSSAATQLIDGLAAGGYVVRQEDAQDRRRVSLTLSAKAKNQIEKMKAQRTDQFLTFFDALNDKEFDQYLALTKKIVGNAAQK